MKEGHQVAEEKEGVILFRYELLRQVPVVEACLPELGAWRTVLRQLGLLGQDPTRYEGYGFGNVSHRLAAPAAFVISGSQTGHLERLGPAEWVRVLAVNLEEHSLVAEGLSAPSSESLTHAALYAVDPTIGCVLHVHSPELFHAAAALHLPTTRPEVPYGTPAMAREISRLYREEDARQHGLAAMAGHLDGILAWGPDPATAGAHLVQTLAEAMTLVGQMP